MMMSKINKANLKKTIYYLKRNGLRDTYLAALERLQKKEHESYVFQPASEDELKEQRKWSEKNNDISFSIVVPAYHTDENYFRDMIESVRNQSYDNFELLIADAGNEERNAQIVADYHDARIRYMALQKNLGISDNTNEALQYVTGDYVGLLDHDDILTPNALYEMAIRIKSAVKQGNELQLLYSDEDKCDSSGTRYFEPHFKQKFNLDLIMTNNYICHFMIIKTELIKKLGFRKAFDGAQDYDLVLRCVRKISADFSKADRNKVTFLTPLQANNTISHVPKILYHWRCHVKSTAENPESKQYAYEAGSRALEDFLGQMQIEARVTNTVHLGFYRVCYKSDMLLQRPDIGAVGGRLSDGKNKITGGIYKENGECPYLGIRKGFSGYMHRAILKQEAYAVDIRNMRIRPELLEIVRDVVKVCQPGWEEKLCMEGNVLDCSDLKISEQEFVRISMEVSKKLHELNYRVVWNPDGVY